MRIHSFQLFIAAATAALILVSKTDSQESKRTSTVSAVFLNQNGEEVRSEVHMVVEGVRQSTIRTGQSFALPYGNFVVSCWSGNAASPQRLITIRQPKTELVFTMLPRAPGDSVTLPWVIRGVVKPAPEKGKIMVARLISLYSHVIEDGIVGPDGSFTVYAWRMSPYKLWILSAGKRVAEQDIVLDYLTSRQPPPLQITVNGEVSR